MRSSKSRSRSKSGRRSVGNIVNRVFDSSGPEGKVRGTPQQIIDKYLQLARDAQLSNDRVAAENFQQHAEHYTRLLSEAQREQEARREQQEAQQGRERQQQPSGEGQKQAEAQGDEAAKSENASAEVIDMGEDGEGGLVETPETTSKPKGGRGRGRSRKQSAESGDDGGEAKAAE